jgi:UDP-N-acetyl-D-galactosamine dehydrogenase
VKPNPTIGVIGLGYVGLPLAVEFGKRYKTLGFDIDGTRITQLNEGYDRTHEVSAADLSDSQKLTLSDSIDDLRGIDVYIVTVPTPIDKHKQPDLSPLRAASRTVGKVISPGAIVIYESTVYPGATEEECIPIIESESGLSYNRDFFGGYSPERINPGDQQHRLVNIKKVTSGSTPEVARYIDSLYGSIIAAGTHMASSIRVAEAAKVIENTQRDINIALVNELALIFNRLGIDTHEVLEAAGTKWNFLPFRPGLVGGHCIGVDPYYLTHKAQAIGYTPEMILAGRRINDSMGSYVVSQVIKLMIQKRIHVRDANVLILGFTFKENCPDIRNTRVIDLVHGFQEYGAKVHVHDPHALSSDAVKQYGVHLTAEPVPEFYDAIIIAVGHQSYIDTGFEKIRSLGKCSSVLYDVKQLFPRQHVDGRL